MDISLLRTFLEVSRTHHFGKAAEVLFVTQSAVSARIRLLEETLGVRLFERKRNDIHLTAAGQRLLRHAETIVHGWARASQDVALEPGFSESLAIGCMADLWRIRVLDWSVQLRQALPDVMLHVEVQPSEVLVQRLISGTLDLAIMFEPPRIAGLVASQFSKVALQMFATRPGLHAVEAVQHDYLIVDWGSDFAASHAQHFPDRIHASMHCGSGGLALDVMLKHGGAAYLAHEMAAPALQEQRIYPVEDAPVLHRYAYAVMRPDGESRPVLQQAVDLLQP